MRKIAMEDIVGFSAYEKMREKFRERIIELKQRRRVSVGDKVTLVFENRETVIFQIQEMMRAEKIGNLDKIREGQPDITVSDCSLAGLQIQQGAAAKPLHPVQVLEIAYGLAEESRS